MPTLPSIFLTRLGELVMETSLHELLPRFRKLGGDDIVAKPSKDDPLDIVTAADRGAEAYLSSRLPDLSPGSIVVGEEAVSADPTILDRLRGNTPVWLVDPLDGTRSFAAGETAFGPMVALVERGTILAAAIHLPLAGELLLAELGQGAFLNGARIEPPTKTIGSPRGTIFSKFMPPALAEDLNNRQAWHERIDAPLCAAHQYAALALGRTDYAVWFRLHPWDHAPGALILREMGGVSRHPDGREYQPLPLREPLLAARSEPYWAHVRAELFPDTPQP